jgi:hypothetical protein
MEAGRRKEGRKERDRKRREGQGVDAVAVIHEGDIISIIMIIKSGPTIAAYEACITLLLLLSTVWCWRLPTDASKDQPFSSGAGLGFVVLFFLGLLCSLELQYLRNELALLSEFDGADALCVQ